MFFSVEYILFTNISSLIKKWLSKNYHKMSHVVLWNPPDVVLDYYVYATKNLFLELNCRHNMYG